MMNPFGVRKMLIRLCENAVQDSIGVYKEDVLKQITENGPDNDLDDELVESIRNNYFDVCANAVYDHVLNASTQSNIRFHQVASHPSPMVYDIDVTISQAAGGVYAIAHYSLTGKMAKAKDCIYLNHFQNSIMETALQELDTIIK